MLIIPAVDMRNGRCVRLFQGDYAQETVYGEDPAAQAVRWENEGAHIIHLVDLDGAKARFPKNQRVLEDIASHTSLKVEFGGGLKDMRALASVFDAGAFRAVCGSVACSEPDTFISWLKKYGGEKIVLGADVKDGFVAVNGWLEKTGMKADDLLSAFIPEGLRTVIVTDISKDGMLSGPAVQLYVDLLCAFPSVQVIASGGVGSMSDIEALEEAGVPAMIVGKAIYEGRIAIEALGRFSDGL